MKIYLFFIPLFIFLLSCTKKNSLKTDVQKEIESKNYETALKLSDSLVKIDPTDAESYLLKSQSLMGLDLPNQAIDELTKVLLLGKTDGETYFLLGHAHFRAGNNTPALIHYTIASKVDSTMKLLNYELGLTYMELKDCEKAIKHFEKEIFLYPRYSESFLSAAECLLKTGNDQKAKQYFEKGLEMGSKYPWLLARAYVGLGIISNREGNYNSAYEYYSKAIIVDPTHSEAYERKAIIHGMRGELDSALKYSNLAIFQDSTYLYAYTTRAIVYEQLNMPDKACEDLLYVYRKDSAIVSFDEIENCRE